MVENIWQAGRFASNSVKYLDEPDPVDVSIVPVNANNQDVAAWPWRYYLSRFATGFSENTLQETYETGLPISRGITGASTKEIDFLIDLGASISLRFRYQASQEWNLNYDFVGSVTGSNESMYEIVIELESDTLLSEIGSGFNFAFNGSVLLPATTLPLQVAIGVSWDSMFTAVAAQTATVSVSIS